MCDKLCAGEHAAAAAAAPDQQHVPEREGHAERAAHADHLLAQAQQAPLR